MHEKIDAVADIMRDIFTATEENLKSIPLIENVKGTTLGVINNKLRTATNKSITETTDILGAVGTALGVDSQGLIKESTRNIKGLENEFRLRSTDKMRKDLFRATQEGINKQPKVITKSGRRWGYKEYMEMNVRTTLAHELGDMQLKFGGDAGVVFYLANTFADSANDHADFQGKYYYDMRYKEFGYDDETVKAITAVIRSKKILPMQYVRENKPYLGTRPNCRHTFTPVSIEQVTNINPKKLTNDLKLSTGTYKTDKYVATQQLRNVELNIRDYKFKAEINKRLAIESTDPKLKAQFNKVSIHNRKLYNGWRNRRKKLIDDNKFLEVDYRRENKDIVLNDLGVKYSLTKGEIGNIENYDNILKTFYLIDLNRVTMKADIFKEWLIERTESLGFDFLRFL